jgi:hypothetical protein
MSEGKISVNEGKIQGIPGISYCFLRDPGMSSAGLMKICADVSTDCIAASSPAKGFLSPKGQSEEHKAQSPAEPHIVDQFLPAPGYLEHKQN